MTANVNCWATLSPINGLIVGEWFSVLVLCRLVHLIQPRSDCCCSAGDVCHTISSNLSLIISTRLSTIARCLSYYQRHRQVITRIPEQYRLNQSLPQILDKFPVLPGAHECSAPRVECCEIVERSETCPPGKRQKLFKCAEIFLLSISIINAEKFE